ncbi:MAG: SRPBCC family protein, partial [Dehalococcoidia bacterium]
MATIEKQIEVEVPTSTAYNQWTQFEEFPKFMEGVVEVQQLQDDRLFWKAEAGGVTKEWYATINKQVPDETVSWYSEGGVDTGGEVSFRPIDDERTEVTLSMSYEPEDLMETVGDKLGFLSRQVEGDL